MLLLIIFKDNKALFSFHSLNYVYKKCEFIEISAD